MAVLVSVLEGTDRRAFAIRVYFPQMLKHQYFWSISSILKLLYCVSGGPLDLLKVEL
jgi:hypothetical protein